MRKRKKKEKEGFTLNSNVYDQLLDDVLDARAFTYCIDNSDKLK